MQYVGVDNGARLVGRFSHYSVRKSISDVVGFPVLTVAYCLFLQCLTAVVIRLKFVDRHGVPLQAAAANVPLVC